MRAKLLPLTGKYYQTTIEYGNIQINLAGGTERASNRQIEDFGFSLDQYLNNEVDPESDYGDTVKEIVNDPGGHYEKQDTYFTALKILEVLNGDS